MLASFLFLCVVCIAIDIARNGLNWIVIWCNIERHCFALLHVFIKVSVILVYLILSLSNVTEMDTVFLYVCLPSICRSCHQQTQLRACNSPYSFAWLFDLLQKLAATHQPCMCVKSILRNDKHSHLAVFFDKEVGTGNLYKKWNVFLFQVLWPWL